MNSESFARIVDERILDLLPSSDPARLFAINLCGDNDIELTLLWSGYARELPSHVVPPAGAHAIALDSTGWAGPMDEGRPSLHPLGRRMHHTGVILGDSEDVSILRCDGSEPELLRGAIGIVQELLLACWHRRPVSA